MIDRDMKLYSYKSDLSSLLMYYKDYDNSAIKVFVKLWPLDKINSNIIDILKFAKMEDVTPVEPNYFETSMSLRPARRHNLMMALWSIKW